MGKVITVLGKVYCREREKYLNIWVIFNILEN